MCRCYLIVCVIIVHWMFVFFFWFVNLREKHMLNWTTKHCQHYWNGCFWRNYSLLTTLQCSYRFVRWKIGGRFLCKCNVQSRCKNLTYKMIEVSDCEINRIDQYKQKHRNKIDFEICRPPWNGVFVCVFVVVLCVCLCVYVCEETVCI